MHKEDENFLNKKRKTSDLINFPSSLPNTIKKELPTNENISAEQIRSEDIIAQLNKEFVCLDYRGKGRIEECQIKANENIFQKEISKTKYQSDKPNYISDGHQKNTQPHHRKSKTHQSSQKTLPIAKYEKEILSKLKANQVIVIAGETGCGKTTQVPQFIYNDCIERNQDVNILITQPRRIAAVSISKRLSIEMDVVLGSVVGYHVGMRPVFTPGKTKILIVTTGIFLQRIIHEKNLNEFTHIILDEVHERDIDIDFVLVLIKHILKDNPRIKLILMSATISTTLFATYFSRLNIQMMDNKDFYKENMTIEKIVEEKDPSTINEKEKNNLQGYLGNWTSDEFPKNIKENSWNQDDYNNSAEIIKTEMNNSKVMVQKKEFNNSNNTQSLLPEAAPIITIAEKTYNVKKFYIDKFKDRLAKEQNRDFSSYHLNFDKKLPKIDTYLYDICFYLIKNIHDNKIQKEIKRYSVLVFLPGFGEIATMHEYMLKNLNEKEFDEIEILRLHSNLSE